MYNIWIYKIFYLNINEYKYYYFTIIKDYKAN